MPTFGSLFAGIGGIDLGLERAGWTGRWQVEWDPFCQHVLAHHWPDVPRYGDITRVDWSTVEPVDLIAGGFPCQPFSFAGKQRGIEDERWLWPEFARVVGELRPRYVLVENVPGLLAGHGGMGHVLGDLASLGYDAEWDSVPAAAVGAPHLRERVWIVAYSASEGRSGLLRDLVPIGFEPPPGWSATALDTSRTFDDWARCEGMGEPPFFGTNDGLHAGVDRLRALGNAVVPQVVEVIGRRLMEAMTENERPLTPAEAARDLKR
jgi:DNA (cytosine-5)-methyltransferase 1